MTEAQLRKEIELAQRDLKELDYPILKVLRRFCEIMDEVIEDRRKLQARATRQQPTRRGPQPSGRASQQRRPYEVKALNRFKEGEPGYEQEQAEIHREWVQQRRAAGFRDF